MLPALQEAEVRLSIASLFGISPEVRAESCRRGLDLPGVPPDLLARLLALLFYNLVVAGRPAIAQPLLAGAEKAAGQTGDSSARFALELGESALQIAHGCFETALARADAALRTAEAAEDPRQWQARAFRCWLLATMGRFGDARDAVTEGIRSAQQGRQGRALQLFEASRARQLLQTGNLADARAALEGRFSPDDAHLVLSVLDADAVVVLGRVALHTADQRQAELTSAIGRVMLRSGVPGIERHAAWLLALQAQASGDPAQARQWLTALGEDERLSLFPLSPLDPADDPQLVRIALACQDRDLAESAAAGAERRAEINSAMPVFQASAVHARGLLTGDPGLLARAVAILETGQRQLALASAIEDLAVAQIPADRSEEAIAALDRALAIYTDCGARWDLARVRRRLRDLGIQRRPPAERRSGLGWAALTESELAVVRLVADGLTNREVAERLYVSPHTVSSHLRHAFEKLGISSRFALTRIVAARAEPD